MTEKFKEKKNHPAKEQHVVEEHGLLGYSSTSVLRKLALSSWSIPSTANHDVKCNYCVSYPPVCIR